MRLCANRLDVALARQHDIYLPRYPPNRPILRRGMVEILAIRKRQCSAVPPALRPGSNLAHQLAARPPLVLSVGFFFGTTDVCCGHRINANRHRDGAWISGHNDKYKRLEL